MHAVTGHIVVDLPVSSVYNQWTCFELFPEFMENVKEVNQIDETRLIWKVTVDGIDREIEATITEQAPNSRIKWQTVDGPAQAVTVTFAEKNGDRTKVKLEFKFSGKALADGTGELLPVVEARVQRNLVSFKKLVEHPTSDRDEGEAAHGESAGQREIGETRAVVEDPIGRLNDPLQQPKGPIDLAFYDVEALSPKEEPAIKRSSDSKHRSVFTDPKEEPYDPRNSKPEGG